MPFPKTPAWEGGRFASLGQYGRFFRRRVLGVILILLTAEVLWHNWFFREYHPFNVQESDQPFQSGCAIPKTDGPRANATILMTARNEEVDAAVHAIRSLEEHFNRWFHYPVLFLNNDPWDEHFIATLTNATSGEATFDVLPPHMWDFPEWMDKEEARASMKWQGSHGVMHGGQENYHHMCRYFSGMFYDVPTIQKYKWYWRVEPHVDFTCAITYDPFMEMEKRGKRYGYTVALWEEKRTVPSLFKLVDEYRKKHHLGTSLWNAFIEAAWVPWPFRKLSKHLSNHTPEGDYWNLCHYWSNFEIADLDFFRSKQYRDFFKYLDDTGGFYFERFGDAPVHSFAAALFLQPKEIHHFEDIGYKHDNYWVQPHNALNKQQPNVDLGVQNWAEEVAGASGCRCERSEWKTSWKTTNVPGSCLSQLGRAIKSGG